MGFLNKNIILLSLFLLIGGCTTSLIKLEIEPGYSGLEMFGQNTSRNFFYNLELTDSLFLKWSVSTKGGFTNNSVVFTDKYVFINDLSGRIYCFDIQTGKQKGMLNYKGSIFTSPIVNKFILYFAVAEINNVLSTIVGYDIFNGVELFKTEIDGKITNELLILDDGLLAVSQKGNIYKFNFKGEQVFTFDLKSNVNSLPVLYSDIIIFSTEDGEIVGVKKDNGKIEIRERISDYPLFNGSIKNDIYYVGSENGTIYSYNLNNRQSEIIFESKNKIVAAPSFDNENIYFGNLAGIFYSINLLRKKLNWEVDCKGLINASAIVTDNKLIIPNLNKKIHLIEKTTGRSVAEYEFEGRIKLTPIPINNLLIVGYDNGVLECYEIK